MNFDFIYVSKACPELAETEAKIVLEHLWSDSRYESATKQTVRDLASDLFPSVMRNSRYIDGRDKIESAIKALKFATTELNRIPKMSDSIGQTDLDIKIAIRYLENELSSLKGDKSDVQ